MRVESSITSVSWIPSEAIRGITKLPFELKVGHYDSAPPDHIDAATTSTALRDADRFRFANHLAGWIEVEDGRIVAHGQSGGGVLNNTHMRVGPMGFTFQAHGFPDLRPDPEVGEVVGDVHPDRRRAAGDAGAPAGGPRPPRARSAHRVDDAAARAPRRRRAEGADGRRHHVPTPLGVRRRR